MTSDKKLDALAALTAFGVLIMKAMLVWPVISDNPNYENGEIAIDDLDEADQDSRISVDSLALFLIMAERSETDRGKNYHQQCRRYRQCQTKYPGLNK